MSETVNPEIFAELHALKVEAESIYELEEKNSSIPADAKDFFVLFNAVRDVASENPSSIFAAKMLLMAIARNKFGIKLSPINGLSDSEFGFFATRMQN
ncbi:MAG: hypothetical protein PHH22_04430 [Clostridia bacterium]|nr:hypothetical protein [Clostridia bacterium]